MTSLHPTPCSLVRLLLPLAAGFAFLISLGELRGREPQDLKTRFLDEAPRGWEEYRAFAERLDGTVSYRITDERDGKVNLHVRLDFKHNANCRIASDQTLVGKKMNGELLAHNSLYAFRLGRKEQSRPWVILGLHVFKDEGAAAIDQQEMAERMSMKQMGIKAHRIDLASLVKQPTFRVLQATPITRDGLDLVKVDFENSHPFDPQARPYVPTQGGSLLLDPSHCWCLHSCDLHEKWLSGDSKVTSAIEYEGTSAKYLIPKRSIETERLTHEEQGLRAYTYVWDCALSEPSNLPPDAEFMLTAFGLPEPAGVEPRRSWSFLWVAVAGFVCLGLGFMLRYRYRRTA